MLRTIVVIVTTVILGPWVGSAQWTPPLGVPQPAFGIHESHFMYAERTFDFGAGPEPYRDAGHGPYTHYVDNTVLGATDSGNPFGSPAKPRLTIPGNLPPGSVVEVHGGPYAFRNLSDKMAVWGSGTASSPIFVRGVSSTERPLLTKQLIVMGSYVVVEHLEFHKAGIEIRPLLTADIHHVSLRHLEMHGDGTESGNSSAIAIGLWQVTSEYTMRNIVIFNNHIHHYGTLDPSVEADWLGVAVSGYEVIDIWVVDNDIHHMGGDSVRVGNNEGWSPPYTSQRAYIGRNLMHDNGENAIDVKATTDVVVSQNRMYNFAPSGSDPGTAAVVHYAPNNVWFIFNEIFNAPFGIVSSGVVNLYVLGNVMHDLSDTAIRFWGSGTIDIVGNTIVRVGSGIVNAGGAGDPKPIVNNIIVDIQNPAGFHVDYNLSTLANNSEFHHNLLFQQTGSPRIRWAGTTYSSLSGFQAGTGKGAGSVEADPRFVSLGTGDFRLASGSPAIDQGAEQPYASLYEAAFGPDIARDFDEKSRGGSPDIGAFEFGEQGSSPPAPTGLTVRQ